MNYRLRLPIMRKVLDPDLLDAIDAMRGDPYEGDAWRVTWPTRDPIVGNSGGGRWAPDNGFETLYTSLEENGAMAEVYHHLSKAPVFSSSQVLINQLQVKLGNVLQLSVADLAGLGIDHALASRIDYSISQAIGNAAHLLDFEGLLVPSARWKCQNLVLFLDRIDAEEQLHVVGSKDVNWPAWRESSPNS